MRNENLVPIKIRIIWWSTNMHQVSPFWQNILNIHIIHIQFKWTKAILILWKICIWSYSTKTKPNHNVCIFYAIRLWEEGRKLNQKLWIFFNLWCSWGNVFIVMSHRFEKLPKQRKWEREKRKVRVRTERKGEWRIKLFYCQMLAAFVIIYSSCEFDYVYAADGRLNEDDDG